MKYRIGQKFGGRKVWRIWQILANGQTLFAKHITIQLATIVSILTFSSNFIRQIEFFTFSPNFSLAKLCPIWYIVIPPVIVKKITTLMIMLKNKNNNPVTNCSKELNVFIENVRDDKAIQVRPIKEVGGGRYDTSFTINTFGHYMISVTVDGHHIPGIPYK